MSAPARVFFDSTPEAEWRELERRLWGADACLRNPKAQDVVKLVCAADVVRFAEDWCWTFDPRDLRTPFRPFRLWPKQIEYLRWLEARFEAQEEFIVEKSRDVGLTWLNMLFAVHGWLFRDGFTAGIGTNKADKVDKLGDPSSIMEKGRQIIRKLPKWMLPSGFSLQDHCMQRRFINPANGNSIIGEAGDEIGRGGRVSILFLDEAAHLQRADLVDAASLAAADCRGWVSSVRGSGNTFARKRHSGTMPVFTFHWRDDPRKTEAWAKSTAEKTDSWIWASEYEIDYGASIEGLIIVKAWIDAAVELGKLLEYKRTANGIGGLDVGGGKSKSVFIGRDGPLVLLPISWLKPDSIDTAHKALQAAKDAGMTRLAYDAIGVGEGVGSALKRRPEGDPMRVHAVNVGLPPSKNRVWEDGRTSAATFKNVKAECWWLVRQRLKRSYELWLFLQGDEGGVEHALDTVMLLPDHAQLRHELNQPRWFTDEASRIIVESKKQLVDRQIPSPDFAEALTLTFALGSVESWSADDVHIINESVMANVSW